MGQIIGGAAKPKRCNINQLSQLGTPAAGEHILVSSDNSMNATGQGNFDSYIEGDGQKAATALELKPIETLAKELQGVVGASFVVSKSTSGQANILDKCEKGKKYIFKTNTIVGQSLRLVTYAGGWNVIFNGSADGVEHEFTLPSNAELAYFEGGYIGDITLTYGLTVTLNDISARLTDAEADIEEIQNSSGKFPFAENSTGRLDGVVKDIYIVDDADAYRILYVMNLFQNGSKQEIIIQSEDGVNFARYQKIGPNSSSVETCDLLRYNSAGTAVTNQVCGRMVVDWSKVDASVVSKTLGYLNLHDAVVTRKSDIVTPVNAMIDSAFSTRSAKFPFTADSTLTAASGSIGNLVIKNLYIYDDSGKKQTIYMQNCFITATKKEVQFTFADGTPYCGLRITDDLTKEVQTHVLYKNRNLSNFGDVAVGTITIDWSVTPYVVGASLGSYNVLDACILRSAYTKGENVWLPVSTFYISNLQQRIYFNEIFKTHNNGFMEVRATGATYPEVTYTDRYIEFNVASAKTISLTLNWYENGAIVTTKTLSVICKTTAAPSTKIICIGDSWTYDGWFEKMVAEQNPNVVFYGTINTQTGILSEGRSGWSVEDYFANTTKNGQTNAFFNPTTETFDFSYYMSQHPTFQDVNVVNILLGMNNAFDTTIIEKLNLMAASILDYNSNIKVIIMGAPQLAADNSGAGRFMQNVHTMNEKFFAYNSAFFAQTTGNGIYLLHAAANIDSVYDYETETVDSSIVNDKQVTLYTNNVHPSAAGYKKVGIALSAFLRNIL